MLGKEVVEAPALGMASCRERSFAFCLAREVSMCSFFHPHQAVLWGMGRRLCFLDSTAPPGSWGVALQPGCWASAGGGGRAMQHASACRAAGTATLPTRLPNQLSLTQRAAWRGRRLLFFFGSRLRIALLPPSPCLAAADRNRAHVSWREPVQVLMQISQASHESRPAALPHLPAWAGCCSAPSACVVPAAPPNAMHGRMGADSVRYRFVHLQDLHQLLCGSPASSQAQHPAALRDRAEVS